MTREPALLTEVLRAELARPQTSWSIGVFGALAEFHRNVGEPASCSELTVVTLRGAIRIAPVDDCRPVPLVPRSAKNHDHNDGVALCLPEAAARIGRNSVLTELGPDRDALREQERNAILFDLGLDTPFGIFCIRVPDVEDVSRVRTGLGKSLVGSPLFAEIVRMSPPRVFMSRLGRIEVYQRIGEHGGETPQGPHTHVLPRLLARRRTHSANLLLPPGLVPCVTFHPKTGERGSCQ